MVIEEKRQYLGHLKLPDGPIEIDCRSIELIQDDIDIGDKQPLLAWEHTTLEITMASDVDDILTRTISYLTALAIKDIEYRRVPGRLVLHYELVTLHYDCKIVCKVYRADNRI